MSTPENVQFWKESAANLIEKAHQRDAAAEAYKDARAALYEYVGQRGGWSTRLLRRKRYRDMMRILAAIGAELGVDG